MALHPSPDYFTHFLTLAGIFVFSTSGAVAGIRRQADLFGVVVLAITASLSGGIFRDILLGYLPPANLRSWDTLAAAGLGAIVTFYFYPVVNRLNNPVEIFDAIGLGAFSVIGAEKGLIYGLDAPWAVVMGVVTAVGGGVARDVLLGQMPIILRTEIYATAAIVGSVIVIISYELPEISDTAGMICGAVACTAIRLFALRYRWHISITPPKE